MGWDALGLVELRRDNMWSGAINAEPIITHRNLSTPVRFDPVIANVT